MKTVIIKLSCIPLLSANRQTKKTTKKKSAETAIIYSSKGSFKKYIIRKERTYEPTALPK